MNHTPAPLSIALVGNQNCGKTTLFNLLTNSHQKVGNWPGVTVERKIGYYKKNKAISIIDTPGTYSLNAFTPDEAVTASFVTGGNADVIINVVDSTNLQRSLYLTTQLLALGQKTVVALNMTDEARACGIVIDRQKLQALFGCPFFCISASKGIGVEQLMSYCLSGHIKNTAPPPLPQKVTREELALQTHQWLHSVINKCTVVKTAKGASTTQKIDKILLNKYLAFPIFVLIISLVFYLSIDGPGGWLTSLITSRLTPLMQATAAKLLSPLNNPWLTALVCQALIGGVMGVVAFLPQICILFGLIALLEGSGYMSRISFVTDKLLRSIGLSGKSFVCFVLGCGCAVPAIAATRTIKDSAEKHAAVTLTPFAPCSAKMAVISFFTTRLLGGKTLFAISFYFASILAVIVGGILIKFLGKKRLNEDIFLQELPKYRLPAFSSVLKQMWRQGKSFLHKAGSTIFLASLAIWFLQSFDFALKSAPANQSMLAQLGKLISPIFYPLGFNDRGCGWQFSVATLSGIVAKETVVTTLEILLLRGVQNSISPLGGYVFVLYNLLTVPCVATISASLCEQGAKRAMLSLLLQLFISYLLCLAIYQSALMIKNRQYVCAVLAIASAAVLLVCALVKAATLPQQNACRLCASKACNAPSKDTKLK